MKFVRVIGTSRNIPVHIDIAPRRLALRFQRLRKGNYKAVDRFRKRKRPRCLADADSYDPKYAKWRYDDLPILPEHWQMVVGKDKQKQFDILKKLMNAPDVTEVVTACDAGREGELIFRSVYELAGCQKPMKRCV